MSIPESVIEAASILQPTAEVRAKCVINALAGDLPDSAVKEAVTEYWRRTMNKDHHTRMRAAIIAALKDVVEGK